MIYWRHEKDAARKYAAFTTVKGPSRRALESGAIHKDWGGRLRVALTMPNTYYVGMSSLALQFLYRNFNAEPDVVCERIFWEKGAAQAAKPLLSLESQRTRRRI